MKKMLMTMALSLAFTCFGFAQGLGSGQTASGSNQAQAAGTPSSTTPSQSGSMSDQNSAMNSSNQMGEKTLKGCIESENGGYTLEQKSGKEVTLAGSEDFSKHVGHEVKVHGTWSSASNSSASSTSSNPSSSASSSATSPSGSSASSENSGKTFNVDKLDMVSEQCSNKK
jgi:hypothetical protein